MLRAWKNSKVGLMLLSALAITGMAVNLAAAPEKITDEDITNAIEVELIFDDAVSSHLIDVDTIEGVVTLSGTVTNMLSRDRATMIAESVKGVRSVVNEITVEPIQRSDMEIKDDVAAALVTDPITESWEIDVIVKGGKVTLTGMVDTWAEKRFAERLARKVKGISGIENTISVSYDTTRPDSEILAEVEGALEWDPYVDEHLIDVSVDKGVVTLSGTVGSAAEKTRARSDAWLAGARSVEADDLEVEPWARGPMERKTEMVLKADSEVKNAVEDALLYDPRVVSLAVDVAVESGEVTLDGTVEDLRAKEAATEDARNTTGVWRVENNLKVRPSTALSDSEIEDSIENALIRDAVVERYDLEVVVRNRKAYLYGMVDSYFEKERAEDVAAAVQGVVDVQNNLGVDYTWAWKDDEEIANDIENEYFWSILVDGDDIMVTVEDGVATLSGIVDNWQEYKAAVDNAFDGGARKVRSNLQVEGVPGYTYRVYESRDDLAYAYYGAWDTIWID
jgi:osmotically-inducible protein OsmY